MSSLNICRLLLIFIPLINFGPIPGGKLTFAHLFSLGLFLIWALGDKLRLPRPAFESALVFLLLIVFNVIVGGILNSSTEQITQLVNYSFMIIIMIVGYTLAFQHSLKPNLILSWYFKVGIVYAVISLTIYIYGIFNGAFLYAITDFFNIANTFDRGGVSGELSETVLPRITGLSPEPSFWSIYMSTVIAVGLMLGLKPYSVSVLFLLLILGLTLARTGMVIIAALTLYLFFKRAPLAFLGVAFFAFLTILLAPLGLNLSEADDSITQRFGSLGDGWNAFLQAPILGLGWGGFKEYSQFNNLDCPVIFNYYLQIAAEGGIVGLSLLVVFLISLWISVPRNAHVVLLAVFVAWLSVPAYNLPYVWFLFGVLLAMRAHTTISKTSTSSTVTA